MRKMYSVVLKVMLLNAVMCAAALMPGFRGESAAKDLKPASVVRYNETIYGSTSLQTDKDNNLFYLCPLEQGYDKNGDSEYIVEKRFVGKHKKVKLNVPKTISQVAITDKTEDFYYCDEIFDVKNCEIHYNDKKRKLHYYNSKGTEIAAAPLPDLWKKVKKNSSLSAECFKRKNNKLYFVGWKGEQPDPGKNRQYVYAEYDIRKKKYTKTKQIKIDRNITNISVKGKYICGIRKTGKIDYVGGRLEDSRKRQILVYDLSGKLLYDIDYTGLLENCTGKTVSDIENVDRIPSCDIDWLEVIANDCLYDVRKGYIYVATNGGIYRCKIGKKNFEQLADLSGCEFTSMNWLHYIMQFVCVDDNTFAFSMGEDDCAPYKDVYVVRTAK